MDSNQLPCTTIMHQHPVVDSTIHSILKQAEHSSACMTAMAPMLLPHAVGMRVAAPHPVGSHGCCAPDVPAWVCPHGYMHGCGNTVHRQSACTAGRRSICKSRQHMAPPVRLHRSRFDRQIQ
eukprot:jgi/Ulvmu1/6517/UM003_0150.1